MKPLAFIVGNDARHAIAGSPYSFSSISFRVVSGAGVATVGGAEGSTDQASATLGAPVLLATPLELPWRGPQNGYNTGNFTVYVPSGTTLSVVGII
jgi:hypothetical protein